jgi:hypothetical protein
MTENNTRDVERLSEQAARRVLARAGELEAAGSVSVDQLREAAREAGITSAAFEQALLEFREGTASSVAGAAPGGGRRLARLLPAVLLVATLLTFLSFFVLRISPS